MDRCEGGILPNTDGDDLVRQISGKSFDVGKVCRSGSVGSFGYAVVAAPACEKVSLRGTHRSVVQGQEATGSEEISKRRGESCENVVFSGPAIATFVVCSDGLCSEEDSSKRGDLLGNEDVLVFHHRLLASVVFIIFSGGEVVLSLEGLQRG